MNRLRQLILRLRATFGKRKRDRILDEELQTHLALLIEQNIERGMSPEAARRAAKLSLGGADQIKESVRDRRGLPLVETLWQDIRYGLRMLRKSPGFTVVAVLTLALGIGANTAIFSLIDGVMLRSLPVRDPSQLVILQWTARRHFINGEYSSFSDCGETAIGGASSGCSFALPIFERIREQTKAFSGVLACAGPAALDLSGNGPASIVRGEIVSGEYFSVLGVNAALGRTLGPGDDLPSASPVVVLSYAYWKSAFGGSPSVFGRTILLNNVPFTIVGVAEPSFTNLSPGKMQDLWMTIATVPRLGIDWGSKIQTMNNWWLLIMARLKPGVSLVQAQTATSLLFRNEVLYGPMPFAKPEADPEIVITRAQDVLVGKRGQLSTILFLLTLAVGIILLSACANVAGLLLSRAATREKEMAVRLGLGASRAKIIRQLLTESILLSFLGGLLGILFAYWGVHAITALIMEGSNGPFPYVIGPDWRVLAFTLGICLLTGIVFGLAPAFRTTRVDLTAALKESASTTRGLAGRRLRFQLGSALVVAQLAFSVIVLIGAGLLVRTLGNLRSINPGFDARNILLFNINPGRLGYKDAQISNLFRELRDHLAALPGIRSVTYSSIALLDGGRWEQSVHVEGQPAEPSTNMEMFAAGPDFFTTMHIPLLEGRAFTPADFRQESRPSAGSAAAPNDNSQASPSGAAVVSALVNEAFVRTYFRGQNPLGKSIVQTSDHSGTSGGAWEVSTKSPHWQIVGVVADTKYDTLRHKIRPVVYLPFTSGYGGYFELRTAADPRSLIPAVRDVAAKLASDLPLSEISTQAEQIGQLMSEEQLVARVSGFFAVLALLLACIGLYGLLAYEVSRRTRELGIRMALGAQQRDILRLVVGQGIVLTIAGVAVGVGVALGFTRYLASLLYGVHANDLVTFLSVATLLTLVALAACYIPARRAMKVNPMVALRNE
jgi:predicted permease